MNDDSKISIPAVKVFSAWAAFGITSWSDVAALLAALYSLLLIGEWVWKRFGRDIAIRWGLIKPKGDA